MENFTRTPCRAAAGFSGGSWVVAARGIEPVRLRELQADAHTVAAFCVAELARLVRRHPARDRGRANFEVGEQLAAHVFDVAQFAVEPEHACPRRWR